MQCNYASPSGSSIWVSGTVVALWYREKSWPETKYCPYQVKLDSRVIPKEQVCLPILGNARMKTVGKSNPCMAPGEIRDTDLRAD